MNIGVERNIDGQTTALADEKLEHLEAEMGEVLDEVKACLGLARISSKDERVKRIVLQIQKHLYIIGAEMLNRKEGNKPCKKTISQMETGWLNSMITKYGQTITPPSEYFAFGEEASLRMDVARVRVKNAERIVSKMADLGMIGNLSIVKYLGLLPDLIFLLSWIEEKRPEEESGKGRTFSLRSSEDFFIYDLFYQKWAIFMGSVIAALIVAFILCLVLHRSP